MTPVQYGKCKNSIIIKVYFKQNVYKTFICYEYLFLAALEA